MVVLPSFWGRANKLKPVEFLSELCKLSDSSESMIKYQTIYSKNDEKTNIIKMQTIKKIL